MSDPRKLLNVFHGSPHAFKKFDPTKIGSGEGAQAYGYGHYFTDKEDIARGYRDRLSVKDERLLLDGKYIPIKKSGGNSDDWAFDRVLQNARQNYFDNAAPDIHPDDAAEVLRNAFVGHPDGRLFADRLKGQTISYQPGGGHMYDVTLGVNPQDLLNWDAPLSTQSKGVREILGDFGYKADPEGVLRHDDALLAALTNPDPSLPLPTLPPDPRGYSIYGGRRIAPSGRKADVSEALRGRGIPGIQYLDGFSRTAGEGTSNYVMFPGTEDLININRRFEQGGPVNTPTEGEGGLYAAPNSTFDTPPPYDWGYRPAGAHAHGGPVEMATGGTTPTSTGGQYQPRESEGPGFFRNNDNYENSYAGDIKFIKNLVQDLSPAQREAQRLVSEATKKSGKEALVFGRGENPADLAKLTQGTYENVSIPGNYAQYALQSADPFYSFHTHATNTLSPSAADLRIWGATQPGTIGLPYQSMFINASPQDSLLRIGEPGKWMDSDAQRIVQEVLNLKNKNEDLVANHGFMDPRMREFWKSNKLPDLAHTFHAESDQMPGVKSYLDKKIPGAAQGASMRDLYAGNFLQRIAELGIPVDVSAEHRIAGTPYLAQDVWPEFAAHVKKHALPKAEGGPVEMSTGGQYDAPQSGGYIRNNLEDMYAGPPGIGTLRKGKDLLLGKPKKPPRLPSEPAWDPARASALQYEIAGEGRGAGPLDLSASDQRIPDIVQEAIPRHDPARGVSPRMQDAINNPSVLYGIEDSIKNGMRIGADRWYHNNPIYQAFTRELGGEQGHTEFMKLMDYNSGSSPRSKVPDNIRNASYYYVNEGRDPRDWAAMPPNPAPYGHLAQDLHRGNADLVRIGEGDWGGYDVFKNPKPPSYGTNLGGNLEPVALDSHAFKNIGMRAWDPRFLATSLSDFLTVNPFSKDSLAGVSDDLAGRASFAQRYGTPNGRKDGKFRIDYAPQSLVNSGRLSMEDALARPALWDAKPRNNEYAAGEKLYQNMSRDMGLAPAEGQSAAWAGAGELTGLGTPADRTFSEMFNERVLLTAKLRGEDPADTLRKLIRREAPLMAEGGTVEDQYHPIWQQSFAGGGQPDRPRLDGFDAMARNRPDEYNPVSASLYPWLMDKEDFGPDYGFRKINGPLDLTHNMDNSLLFQSREPFEGRGFTLTPEEKRARWLEKRGLEDKPESTLNPYDLIKMYADDLGRRHKEWKPSYSGESLPWQMLQSTGDLGRVVSKSITGGLGDTLSASMRPWDGSYEDRLMQENDLTRQSERDIHPFLKDISSIPAMISHRLWAGPAIGDAVTNLAWPADSVGEWADNQTRPFIAALRNVPHAASMMRDMFSGVRPTGGEDPGYFAHGGPVGYAGGGHAKDTGNTFDFLGPFGAGLNIIADGIGALGGEDFELDKALGYLGEIGGSLVAPGVGGPLGRGAGTMAAHLIEPGEGDVGRDALNAGYGALRGGMGMFMAHGGPVGFWPQSREGQDPNDLTRFLPPPINPSEQPDPMDWAASGGIPGAVAPPINANNGQKARDDAERQRLMAQAEAASVKGLQSQSAGGGGGGSGIGGMLSSLAPFAAMIPGYGPMISMGMKAAGSMMAAEGGPVPAPDGEQPWMYGDGALMARGGYLRGCGGMNG